MSAVPEPMSPGGATLEFARMRPGDLQEVQRIENDTYPHPWTRGNFLDSLESGYDAWVVRDADGVLAGYFLLMFAVDEAHLLNITVRPDLQRRGLGRILLDRVVALARQLAMPAILLEVRPSNLRALHVYQCYGFVEIGRRKRYYPAANNTREDAIVMRLCL
jgi:ribosomal-protein-alanine N-acetyltransferase